MKRTTPAIILSEYAAKCTEKRRLQSMMEAKITAIRSRYSDRIKQLDQECEELYNALMLWAQSHPEEFAQCRSIDFPDGTIGIRRGKPSVQFTKPEHKVIELARRYAPQLIMTKEAINKNLILADREYFEQEGILKKIGIAIEQHDHFYINLREDNT